MARPKKQIEEVRESVSTPNLDNTTAALNKAYGDNFIMRMGDKVKSKIDVISTGSLSLDSALGIGGFPRGRIVEIYGPESSGKTTLALHAIATAQASGGICAFIDVEHALDPDYAAKLGVNIEDLYISQPDCGEAALEAVHSLLKSGDVAVIVVDSVAALIPAAELAGEMGDSLPGLQARLMSQGLRKIVGICAKSNTLVIFINQLRMKIGVMYGNPETTTGGHSLKFYASVRLDVRRRDQIKTGDEITGNRVEVKVVKNKMAPPLKKAQFEITYGGGINRAGELVDVASEIGVITKKGAWFSFEEEHIGQGRENAINFILGNRDVYSKIEKRVLEKIYEQ